MSPLQKKVHFYVNYGERATDEKYIWYSSNGSLEISTKDPKFRREGAYFVTVYPRYQLWDRLTDDYYKYMIVYTTQDMFIYLQSQVALDHIQDKDSTQFYRHFVTKANSDISVSMTVFSGNPNLFLSVNPNNKQPTELSNDFTSKNQSLISGSKGKALFIPQKRLQKSNGACSNQANMLNTDTEPCAIFAAVYCKEECKYSLKLAYEREGP